MPEPRQTVSWSVSPPLRCWPSHEPLLCIVEDAQWLDQASAQILGFVARRILAERIAVVCAARTGRCDDALARLPELQIGGLGESDARALLLENVRGPLDAAVCDQILRESHGNPLALLELPRTWSAVGFAGGFGHPDGQPVAGKIERSYATRLLRLPAGHAAAHRWPRPQTRSATQSLLNRAARASASTWRPAGPAVDAGLLKLGGRVEFPHPLARSAAYRAADDR